MRLFRKHLQVEPTLEKKLLEAKAKLARYKQLPDSDFTKYGGQNNPLSIRHGVDEKPIAIARVKADIAELEVRLDAEGGE